MNTGCLKLARGLLLVVGITLLPLNSGAFDTLMTSPMQRVVLNDQRKKVDVNPLLVYPVKAVPSSTPISFEGVVIRQKASSSFWFNGQLLDKSIKDWPFKGEHKKKAVELTLPSYERVILLKPGQLFNQESGVVSDNYYNKNSQRNISKISDDN